MILDETQAGPEFLIFFGAGIEVGVLGEGFGCPWAPIGDPTKHAIENEPNQSAYRFIIL